MCFSNKELSSIANESALQVQHYLGLDSETSQILVSEILNEKNSYSKISKFSHLLVDRLINSNEYDMPSQPKILSNLIESIKMVIDTTPSDASDFISWLPQYIKQQTILLINLQKQVQGLREENEIYKKKNEKLRQSQIQILQKLGKYQGEVLSLKNQRKSFSSAISEIQEQMHQHWTDEKTFLAKEENLKNENHNLRLSIIQLQDMNQVQNRKLQQMKMKIQEMVDEMKILKDPCAFIDLRDKYNELLSTYDKTNQEKTKIQKSFELLQMQYQAIDDQNDLLRNDCQAIKNENKKLKDLVNQFQLSFIQFENQLNHGSIQSSATQSEIIDLHHKLDDLQQQLEKSQADVKKLTLECVKAESIIMKNKDAEYYANNLSNNQMNIQQAGYLLADAVGSNFNVNYPSDELKRLIEIARRDHIRLFNPTTPINPFKNQEIDYFDNTGFQNFNSKFDELDQEIAKLQSNITF